MAYSLVCCLCSAATTSDNNIINQKTIHSNILIYKIIEIFLENPIQKIKDDNFVCCNECIKKINEYDLANVKLKKLKKDLSVLIRQAETKFQCLMGKYKIVFNEVIVEDDVKIESDFIHENRVLVNNISNKNVNICVKEEDTIFHLNANEQSNNEDQISENSIITNNCSVERKDELKNKNITIKYKTKYNYEKKTRKIGKNYCLPCNMNLVTKKDYNSHCKTKRHKSIVNGTITFQCENCGKRLLTETGLKDHITYFHTDERKHLCTVCNKYFATGNLLCYHRNREHPDAFKCPICQKRLIDSYLTMEEHIEYVHKNKPVECVKCNIKYKNLHSLYQHRKAVHINMRLFQCELCGKKFNENNALQNHIKYTHEKIKNFSCDLCNFKTTTKSVLVRHMRIHTGEKKFNCEICGKNYVAKYNLERHIKTLHNIKKNIEPVEQGVV